MISEHMLAFLTCVTCTFGCMFSDFSTSTCTSVAEAIREGDKNWVHLKIHNDSPLSLVNLQAGSFQNIPNLESVSIRTSVNNIESDAFRGLTKLQKLQLFNNPINKELPKDVFDNLPVENMYIVNNGIQGFKKGTFSNMPNLKVLFIRENNITVIKNKVFSDTSIEELYLESNKIQIVKNFAFVNMEKLVKLSLSDNLLKMLDTKLLFGTASTNLNKLWINKNHIKLIKKDMFAFSLLPKLKYLFLEMNDISQIENYALSNLTNLITLDLSNNKLDYIHPDVFFGKAEKLELLFLHNNRLTFLDKEVLERLPKLEYFTLYGNPWQCPCYLEISKWLAEKNATQVCRKEYDSTGRPTCILGKETSKYCIRDPIKNKDLYEEFVALPENMNLPSENFNQKCNFAEGYENLAWGLYPDPVPVS